MIVRTMRSLVTVLLLCCAASWSSASEFYTVDVQPGEGVTLLCSNFSASVTQIIWFRSVKKQKPACICFIFNPSEPASFCEGFNKVKFEATTNISTVFLRIRQVDLSDSGLYFCGYYLSFSPVIISATYLEVRDSSTALKKISWIFVGLTVILILVIVGLVVTIKKLQRDHIEEHSPQETRSQGSDDLNYAEVKFHPRSRRNPSVASEQKVNLNAINSSTRLTEEAPGAEPAKLQRSPV